jgi:putative protease
MAEDMEKESAHKNNRRPEILAPAGGMEHLIAAVRTGANAVYLGAKNFNARRNAQNFDDDALREAVSYCHARGVKVYVTLNTLVLDKEIAAAADEIAFLASCAVDGLIVQDLGIAAIARQMCSSLPLHASTQMTIHNASGANALEKLGFTRVVLARELSETEIRTIAESTSLELEVFVHGALCMSVSGQCYLSAMLGGRSGNRGLCAQPCRLEFTSGKREYALSLKDLSLVSQMDRLKALGVAALKIEGRMKRPEYVAAAVTACRDALDGKEPNTETLRAVFSRSGFTSGYFDAKRDISMFGTRTKEDVLSAGTVLAGIAASCRNETPLIPVDMKLLMHKGTPAVLTVSDGMHTVKAQGPVPEEALKSPLTEEIALRSLKKTGGTPFYLNSLSGELDGGLTLPVSALNAMRKDALAALEKKRGEIKPLPFSLMQPLDIPTHPRAVAECGLRLRFRLASQIPDEAMDAAEKLILPIEEIAARPQMIQDFGARLVGELPLLVFPQDKGRVKEALQKLKSAGLKEVSAGNPGTIEMAKDLGFAIHGDYSLNLLNSYALKCAEEIGLADATLSFETGLKQASFLASGIPIGIIAYGRLPLMTFRNCPAKSPEGCSGCTGRTEILDRMKNAFPVVCRGRSYSQLLNMLPLYLADKQDQLGAFDFITLYFTVEDRGECGDIVRRYMDRAPAPERFTRGLYFRSLE